MATRLGVAASLWQTEHPDIPSLSVPGMEPSAVVVGAGPGIGLAVARRFAREGFAVALIARRQDALDGYVLELLGEHDVVLGVAADAADPAALEGAWATVVAALGDPEVLVYNAMGARPLGARPPSTSTTCAPPSTSTSAAPSSPPNWPPRPCAPPAGARWS